MEAPYGIEVPQPLIQRAEPLTPDSSMTNRHVLSPSRSDNLPMAIMDSHNRELEADRTPDDIASARNFG